MYKTVEYEGVKFLDYTKYDIDPMDMMTSEPLQYIVKAQDIGRLDLISKKMYGRFDYYKYILIYNNILDPFNGLTIGQNIRIPLLTDIANYETYVSGFKKWQ